MGYDDVIPLLGDFGRYQKRIYLLLCLPAIICAFHKLSNVFIQAKPSYRCQLASEYPNASYPLPVDVLKASIPYDELNQRYSSCSRYENGSKAACNDGYIFDRTTYESTSVMEWEMVCDRAYMTATGDALFMLGVMLGSIGFGELSDRYGRKLIFFISLMAQVTFGLVAAVAPEFWTYTVCRFIVGATTSGVFLVAYVIAMEMVGPSKRLLAGVVCQMFFSSGYMLTALFAYYIHDWRHLQIALTIPGLLFFSYWWFVPESARWLISNNRIPEAKLLIHKAAKENKVIIPEEHLDMILINDAKPADPNEKRATIIDLFRHPNMRNRSLIIFIDWFTNSATYYGLSWNSSNLGGNDYLNFVISGAVEIPAYTFLLLTLNIWGRKSILCGSMVVAGVSLLLTMAVPKEYDWLVVTLAMIGKLGITASYGTVYIFSVEQFPTVIRNAGLGAASTSARMGSILAPLINLLSEVWKPFPLIIFGFMALAGGILSLLLPETLNKKLPETIADGEQFGKKEKTREEEPLNKVEVNGTIVLDKEALNGSVEKEKAALSDDSNAESDKPLS